MVPHRPRDNATQQGEHALESPDKKSPESALQVSTAVVSGNLLLSPPVPALQSSAIHLWVFPLATSESAYMQFAEMLSIEERARAARFHFEKDAHRFAVARASVRSILGGYTLIPARDVHFVYSEYGKPSLAAAALDIRFSVSHSGDLASLAVARGREVGADIEAIREGIELEKLAERFFSPRECQSLLARAPEERLLTFFRYWTCKEAFLKAQGVGLSRGLATFDVDLDAGRARLVSTRPDPREADRWALQEFEPAREYAGAVAVEGSITAMSVLRCTGGVDAK